MTEVKQKAPENDTKQKSILRQIMALAIPIALQGLISAAVNAADVMMIGQVGQSALSAVSIAGQVVFVLQLFYMGLSGGLSILAAQYWGKGDKSAVERVLGFVVALSMFISVLFFLLAELIPGALLSIFSGDAVLVELGTGYLRILAPSFLLMGLSQMLLVLMKNIGRASWSTLISAVSLLINIVLNAVCIFGICHKDPAASVLGIAVCTCIARLAETLWCFLFLCRAREGVRLRKQYLFHPDAELLRDYAHCTAPLQLNFIIWGCGLSATSAIMGHVSSDLVAANAVASTVKNLAIVLCNGIAGSSILIGQQLGRGDLASAKKTGRYLFLGSLLFGALAGMTLILFRPLIMRMAVLEPSAAELLEGMLWICGVYCIGKSFNSTLVSGVFSAGGDTKFGLLCDTIVMWCIIVPLGCLAAFLWKMPALTVYLILCLDEFIKIPAVILRYRKGKWLQNITRS